MRPCFYVTHPNVVVDAAVPWLRDVTALHCSNEQKAIDGAAIWAAHLGIGCTRHDDLGENDRSATGFLPPEEFERVADAFFAQPTQSVRGWERAVDAQRRVVARSSRLPRCRHRSRSTRFQQVDLLQRHWATIAPCPQSKPLPRALPS